VGQHGSWSCRVAPAGGAIRFETIAKPFGGHRVLTHLGPGDSRRYETAVAAVVPVIERRLSSAVVANRASPTSRGFRLEPWTEARSRFERSLRRAAGRSASAAFVGDVADCYGSMTPAIVHTALRRVGVPEEFLGAIARLLGSFEARGVRGLPIGPAPSAVLANAVLAAVDEALERAGSGHVFRWVDDVVVVASGVHEAARSARAFHDALEALGLAPAETKCAVLDDLACLPWRVLVSGAAASSPQP
jgi:hypothetical protein